MFECLWIASPIWGSSVGDIGSRDSMISESASADGLKNDFGEKDRYIGIVAEASRLHYLANPGNDSSEQFAENSAFGLGVSLQYPVLDKKTLLGATASWTMLFVNLPVTSTATVDWDQWFVGAELTHFWGPHIGRGPYVDTSLGLLTGSVEVSDNKLNTGSTEDFGFGYGGKISAGYAFPVGRLKRWSFLAGLNYMITAFPNSFVFGTFGINAGILF